MEAIHLHNSMATEAVKTLIAISDTVLPLCSQQTRVDSANFFGPWIADDKWSPRKSNTASPAALKKQASSISNVSKSLPRRLSLFTSANINNSPYGSYRNQSPAEERGSFRSKSRLGVKTNRSFLTTENIRRSKTRIRGVKDKKTKKGEEDDELGDEEEEEEDAVHKNEQSQFSKPSLPALITLTSNTNDVRSTFALGKQLQLPLPRVYVSIDPKQSSRTNKSCSSALHAAMSNSSQIFRHQNVIDNFIGNRITSQNDTNDTNQRNGYLEKSYTFTGSFSKRDVSQCRSEALQRALAARNPPPPIHNYDDISEHMRHYRLHHTVLGTGRFSLANEQDEREAQPVQWQDLFPDRPLTAAKSITEVPVFRFSVADFRSQTAPSTKEVPTSLSPLPGTGFLKCRSPQDDQENTEISPSTYVNQNSKNKKEECSDTSTATDEQEQITFKENTSVNSSHTKCSSLQLEERYAKATRRSSFTVYNDSIQQVQKSPNYRNGEDNEYMQYLRAKNGSDKRSIFKQKTFESISVEKSKAKSDVQSETQTCENTQIHDENLNTPKVEGDRLSNNASKKVTKQSKIIKGSNISPRKCEGQYGPTTRAQQHRFGMPISSRKAYVSFEKHHQFSKLSQQRLLLDAERVRESIEEKIDQAERRLRSSINEAAIEHMAIDRRNKTLWRKIYKIERGFENTTKQTSNGLDDDATSASNIGNLSQGLAQQSEDDETDAFFKNLLSKRQEIFNDNTIGKGEEIVQNDYVEKTSVPGKKSVSSQSRNSFSLVTSYDFRGYVESLRSKHLESEAKLLQDVDKYKDESKESFPGRSEASMVTARRSWRPRDSRVKSAARESRNRGQHYKAQGDRPKSQLSTGDEDSDRLRQNTSSATLRFKPTSPATSAFVIAAPSNSSAARGRSVVLPLEDFLEMAVDGRDQSFADWKTCLNNSSIGAISRSQVGDFQRSRGDGLLKVVSFATPVNQFIFAKKVTLDSTDGLGVFPSQARKKKRAEEKNLVGRNVSSRRYRLKLSDFGLPEKFQRKAKNKHASEESKEEKVEILSNASKAETISKEETDFEKVKELLMLSSDECDETHHIVPTKSGCTESQHDLVDAKSLTKSSSLSEVIPSAESHVPERDRKTNFKETPKRGRSVSAEAHACLRKEILRLMEAKKSDNIKGIAKGDLLDCKDGTLKEYPKDNDVKEKLTLQSLDETVRNDAHKQESRPVTTSLQDMKSSDEHRSSFRRRDSLSPRRLNLRHAARRSSGQDRSLSPARVHKYFQRRWSNTEHKKTDLELNLSPLAIKGGSLNIKSSSFESETKPASYAVQDDVGETATESRALWGRSNTTLSAQGYSLSLLETDYARDRQDVTINNNDVGLSLPNSAWVKTSLSSEDDSERAKQNLRLKESSINFQSCQPVKIEENTGKGVTVTEDENIPSAYICDKHANDRSHRDNSYGSGKSEKYVRFSIDS